MKKFASLLVALCLVAGMNSTTFAQTTYSVVIKDLVSPYPVSGLGNIVHIYFFLNDEPAGDRQMEETAPLLTPGLYEYTTDAEDEVPGLDFDEWHVKINPANNLSFPYAEPNPTSLKSSATYHFEWVIVDNRP